MTAPDSGVRRGATTVGMSELQPRPRYGNTGVGWFGLQSGKSGRDRDRARPCLEAGANFTEVRGLAGNLGLLFDVQVSGVLHAPAHQRKHSDERRPDFQAAAT